MTTRDFMAGLGVAVVFILIIAAGNLLVACVG